MKVEGTEKIDIIRRVDIAEDKDRAAIITRGEIREKKIVRPRKKRAVLFVKVDYVPKALLTQPVVCPGNVRIVVAEFGKEQMSSRQYRWCP